MLLPAGSGGSGTGHDRHCIGHAVRLRSDGGRALTEASNVDPVRDVKDVGHVVADQDDGQTPVPKIADELQDLV